MTYRALVVTHYFAPHVGGVETVAGEHVSKLRRRGWEVALYTTRLPRDASTDPRIGDCRRFAACNVLEERLGVPVPIPTPQMLPALIHAAERADVVVAHGHVYPTSVYAAVAARRARRPFVVVQHNPFVDFGQPLNAVQRFVDAVVGRRVLQHADRVVCVSRFTEQYVKRISPVAATVVVMNGVDVDRFRPVAPVGGHPARRRVVTLRRLVARNGVDVLLDAWRLAAIGDRAELLIGGTGPAEPELQRRAEQLRGVRFVGRVTSADHAAFYQSAWIAAMPTVTGEGFGLMAAEALACGVPVVASAQGALPEIVRHGENGMLVPAAHAPSLARALRRLVDNPAFRERLAAGARSPMSWEHSVDELERILRSVIAGAQR